MADLMIRVGWDDIALIERVLAGPPRLRPHRVLAEAHAVPRLGRVQLAARRAGIPYLIDPETHFLQDNQHAEDPWVKLPYGESLGLHPADLLAAGRLDSLVAAAVEHQIAQGATMLIAPYVHIPGSDQGWVEVQVQMWRSTRRYLDKQAIALDVIAVIALDWRLLERATWPAGLGPLVACLRDHLDPSEIGLAGSKVDQGTQPALRLAAYIAVIRQLRRTWPVIAWQQGLLGEAAVAAGAAGYECGIGCRERCDLSTHMRSRRVPSDSSSPRSPRGVYIAAVRRSMPRRSLQGLVATSPRIASQLVCLEPACCPHGQEALLVDARAHSIGARRQGLDRLTTAAHPAWRWNHLSQEASAGLAIAGQINLAAQREPRISRLDTGALNATFQLAETRRQALGKRAA